jgi:hypothetical protein
MNQRISILNRTEEEEDDFSALCEAIRRNDEQPFPSRIGNVRFVLAVRLDIPTGRGAPQQYDHLVNRD